MRSHPTQAHLLLRALTLALVTSAASCAQTVPPQAPTSVPATAVKADSVGAAAAAARSVDLRYGPECDGTLLQRAHYTVCHQDQWHEPRWVVYNLTAEETLDRVARQGSFRADPDLPGEAAAEPGDYRASGYAQGHMAPADDFRFSAEAVRSTFLLSNAVPQSPSVNGGRWAVIEREVEALAAAHGELWIISGPLFLDDQGRPNAPSRFIGASRVAVPSHVFKAVLCVHRDGSIEAFAFVVPNSLGRIPGPSSRYLVSVDDLERLAGLDLFSALDDAIEEALEGQPGVTWPIRE